MIASDRSYRSAGLQVPFNARRGRCLPRCPSVSPRIGASNSALAVGRGAACAASTAALISAVHALSASSWNAPSQRVSPLRWNPCAVLTTDTPRAGSKSRCRMGVRPRPRIHSTGLTQPARRKTVKPSGPAGEPKASSVGPIRGFRTAVMASRARAVATLCACTAAVGGQL